MSRLRTIAVLPTLFTLGNLICGFFAIVVAARIETPTTAQRPTTAAVQSSSPMQIFSLDKSDPVQNCMLAGWLIFIAMIFDALDGHIARLVRSSSDFGAQLDSLCDAVTFGVAPAFLLVKMCPGFTFNHSKWIWVIAAAFAACAVLRLARFNAELTEDDDHSNFSGLPSPAGAAAIASFAILFYRLRNEANVHPNVEPFDIFLQNALPFFAVLVGVLMVSRVPYPHLMNHLFRGQRSLGHVVALVFAAVAVVRVYEYALPVLAVLFVLSGPVRYLWQEAVERRPHKEPMF